MCIHIFIVFKQLRKRNNLGLAKAVFLNQPECRADTLSARFRGFSKVENGGAH